MARVTPRTIKAWLPVVAIGAAMLLAGKLAARSVDWLAGAGERDRLPLPPGQQPTLTASQAAWIAEQVYAGAWEGWVFWDNERVVIDALSQCANDADVVAVFNAYGVRQGPMPLDWRGNLVRTVLAVLSDSERQSLNATFAQKGIQSRF
ncbi:MAG: hypothetical protein N2483_02670 [Burkholderiaceae bacterium]|nr:hypothetical protein [Burkholderiaceae bacterium]